jgi:hypothetical protein
MKQQVNPALIIAAIAILVLIVGFIGWKALSGGGGGSMDDATVKAHMAAKAKTDK